MFVGGPNSRKDYHLEEGEEVGTIDTCLKSAIDYHVSNPVT